MKNKVIMIARKRKTDGKTQEWYAHSKNVSELCFQEGIKLGLGKLAKLTGLLHDFGKGTLAWQRCIHGSGFQHPSHADLGARYVWERWSKSEKDVKKRQTAQMISLCIYGHHAGLPDCLEYSGRSPWVEGMSARSAEDIQEAAANFYAEVASADKLDKLFGDACGELAELGLRVDSFEWGLMTRLLLSVLVDADRWDAECFEYDEDSLGKLPDYLPDWEMLLGRLEACLKKLPEDGELVKNGHEILECCKEAGELEKIRQEVSDCCGKAGEGVRGIYTLSVPTGGGKTFASLRYSLTQAKTNGQRRIFYFIPMNTIMDQNAEDIRKALGGYPSILEYHSNVVSEENAEEEQDQRDYRRLTERWAESDIILTSLVNFLDALFRKENSKTRRANRLVNSVLVFDEIQVLPKRCRRLFEKAITFLVDYCNCTVLLCTATQPLLKVNSREVIEDTKVLYQKLKRVTYVPILKGRTYQEAAADIAALGQTKKSVLIIVNTKYAAWCVYQEVSECLKKLGYHLVEGQQGLSEEELGRYAEACGENEILCVHLSTLMCPAHRKEILRWVKVWLKKRKPVYCISTALIEAGINISFPVVVRSLAGIPSIIQAAGRCNRNYETGKGTVYLWNFSEEKLGLLSDIQIGKEISMNLLRNLGCPEEIDSLGMIERYFAKEEAYTWRTENYPFNEWNSDLVEMLSKNEACQKAAKERREKPLQHLSKRFRQSFRTAGTAFRVIDQETKCVLIPYGRGRTLIGELAGSHLLSDKIRYLKEAQQYSVNLFEQIYERLKAEEALHFPGETGIAVLKEEYYDAWAGVRINMQEMEKLS